MIPIEHYSTVYHIGISFLVLVFCIELTKYSSNSTATKVPLSIFSFVVLTYVILFIGLRDPYASSLYLGDTGQYTRTFNSINDIDISITKDVGFYVFMKLLSPIGVKMFYLICAAIYILLPHITFKKWFGKYAIIATIVMITSMSFWSFGINGLRNGLAAAFFIYAIGLRRKTVWMIVWMIISISFHKSMLLPTVAYFLSRYVNNTKYLIYIWSGSILVSFFVGKSSEIFINNFFDLIGFQDSRIDNIYADELDGLSLNRGFRIDFILYSSVAIILGYYYVIKKGFKDVLYTRLLNTYIIANTAWILLIYVNYTNRVAYLSWFLMPIIFIYPLLRGLQLKNKIRWEQSIIMGSLIFTLLIFFK